MPLFDLREATVGDRVEHEFLVRDRDEKPRAPGSRSLCSRSPIAQAASTPLPSRDRNFNRGGGSMSWARRCVRIRSITDVWAMTAMIRMGLWHVGLDGKPCSPITEPRPCAGALCVFARPEELGTYEDARQRSKDNYPDTGSRRTGYKSLIDSSRTRGSSSARRRMRPSSRRATRSTSIDRRWRSLPSHPTI